MVVDVHGDGSDEHEIAAKHAMMRVNYPYHLIVKCLSETTRT